MSGTSTNLVLLGVRARHDLESYMRSVGVQGINSIVEGANKKITFMKGFVSHDAFGSHPVRSFRHLNQNEECILIIQHSHSQTPEPQELCRLINTYLGSNLSHLNRSNGYKIDIFAGSLSDVITSYQKLPSSSIAQGYGLVIHDHALLPAEYLSDSMTSNSITANTVAGGEIPRLMGDCVQGDAPFRFTEGLEESRYPPTSKTNYYNPAPGYPQYQNPMPPQAAGSYPQQTGGYPQGGNYQQGGYYQQQQQQQQQYGGPGQPNWGLPGNRHHG